MSLLDKSCLDLTLEKRWPSRDIDHVEAFHLPGIDVYTNYFIRGDVVSVYIGKMGVGMKYSSLGEIDSWIHEFIECGLVDLIYNLDLHNSYITINAYDDEFDIRIPHLLTSLFTASDIITRGKIIELSADEFEIMIFGSKE